MDQTLGLKLRDLRLCSSHFHPTQPNPGVHVADCLPLKLFAGEMFPMLFLAICPNLAVKLIISPDHAKASRSLARFSGAANRMSPAAGLLWYPISSSLEHARYHADPYQACYGKANW